MVFSHSDVTFLSDVTSLVLGPTGDFPLNLGYFG